jgi:hypothetical protein
MRGFTWCLVLLGLFLPKPAHAYAWMIRHGYAQCVTCHVDPSGAGALSAYGREIADSKLRTQYGPPSDSRLGNFLFGAVELPEQFDFRGDLRVLGLSTKVERSPLERRLVWMQLDARATLQDGPIVASATLGYAPKGALGAALTRTPDSNVVSREHWLGAWLNEDRTFLLRAGRMNVPFGVRSIEHTLWARAQTGTDINDQQQFGVSASLSGDSYRAELMAIIGSFQIRPDAFRQRGYSGYFEYTALPTLGVGVSSRLVHLELDPRLLKEEWKHAHGLFGRWATPWKPLVLLGEGDYVLESPKYQTRRTGVVGYLQADIEPTDGVHLMGTLEASNVSTVDAPMSFGTWLSYQWFFAPHADIRLDNIYQSIGTSAGRMDALSFLIQGHLSL